MRAKREKFQFWSDTSLTPGKTTQVLRQRFLKMSTREFDLSHQDRKWIITSRQSVRSNMPLFATLSTEEQGLTKYMSIQLVFFKKR
ncbi:hypothetical protein D3Z09_18340 [Rahnella aquatilis]|nr:hypothetical protein D3Z09_18340 [Rahnella aquatilis]